ncbi:hypothetical protein D4R49_01875 [bacterium]|nr:MAG: hypothetical protein D4R49_01875 [bacterium]
MWAIKEYPRFSCGALFFELLNWRARVLGQQFLCMRLQLYVDGVNLRKNPGLDGVDFIDPVRIKM